MSDLEQKCEDIEHEIAQLRDLMQRRLLEDKNTRQLIQSVNASLERRDAIDSRKTIAPMVKEILLAVDRLHGNAPAEELNKSVGDELLTILSRYGVEPIETNGVADPKVHNIVGLEPVSGDVTPGTIVKVLRTGYTLAGSVLRPAEVIVAHKQ